MIINHKTTNRKDRLLAAYSESLDSGLSYKGHTYQIDEESLTRIANKLALSTGNIQWRTKDNEMVEFTRTEFKSFAKQAESRRQQLLNDYWSNL